MSTSTTAARKNSKVILTGKMPRPATEKKTGGESTKSPSSRLNRNSKRTGGIPADLKNIGNNVSYKTRSTAVRSFELAFSYLYLATKVSAAFSIALAVVTLLQGRLVIADFLLECFKVGLMFLVLYAYTQCTHFVRCGLEIDSNASLTSEARRQGLLWLACALVSTVAILGLGTVTFLFESAISLAPKHWMHSVLAQFNNYDDTLITSTTDAFGSVFGALVHVLLIARAVFGFIYNVIIVVLAVISAIFIPYYLLRGSVRYAGAKWSAMKNKEVNPKV